MHFIIHDLRPSDLVWAIETLKEGERRRNDICNTALTSSIGVWLSKRADETVERHSKDTIADKEFTKGCETTSQDMPKPQNRDPEVAVIALKNVRPAGDSPLWSFLKSYGRT